jgi:metal-dependent amidase/aminoacylase/carboxypeptidase family protein
MGSEDFAEIAQKVPSAYYMLGAAPAEKEKQLGQHNPKIEINEAVLPIGAAIYAQAALDWLRENGA